MTRFRLLFALSAVIALATMLVACGGDDDDGGGDVVNENPQKVLDRTFSGETEKVDSGTLDIKLNVEVSGEEGGNIAVALNGPFDSQGDKAIPKFDLTASTDASGSGDDFSFEGGLLSTSDAAFVNYKDTDYEVTPDLFDQFKTQFESAAAKQPQNQEQSEQLLNQLGLDQSVLTNLTNEGEADVEGAPTVHISGDLDVDKAVDSLKNVFDNPALLETLGATAGAQLPSGSELEQAKGQLDQLKGAITEASFDVYSGTEDDLLRRLTIVLVIEPPTGDTDKVDLGLDVALGAVNEAQTIEAPADAKPLEDLLTELGIPPAALSQLGALGNLGGSGGGGNTSPALPGAPGGQGSTSQPSQEALACLQQATSAADLQRCEALLR